MIAFGEGAMFDEYLSIAFGEDESRTQQRQDIMIF